MKKILLMMCVISSISFANTGNLGKSDSKYKTRKVVATRTEIIPGKSESSVVKSKVVDGAADSDSKGLISGKADAIKKVSTNFVYSNDSIYEIYTMPNFITTIKLNPDEEVVNIALGDSSLFALEQTLGGDNGATYIYIKPLDKDATTNLNILTTRRSYFFTVHSVDTQLNPLVQFVYPDELDVISKTPKIVGTKPTDTQAISNTDTKGMSDGSLGAIKSSFSEKALDNLDFDYKISNKNTSFSPVRIYSNDYQTFIEMPSRLAESPVLFVVNDRGEYEVVNYRQEDNKILVDRKITRARLVLGNKKVDIYHK